MRTVGGPDAEPEAPRAPVMDAEDIRRRRVVRDLYARLEGAEHRLAEAKAQIAKGLADIKREEENLIQAEAEIAEYLQNPSRFFTEDAARPAPVAPPPGPPPPQPTGNEVSIAEAQVGNIARDLLKKRGLDYEQIGQEITRLVHAAGALKLLNQDPDAITAVNKLLREKLDELDREQAQRERAGPKL